jgi:hypothetical protein
MTEVVELLLKVKAMNGSPPIPTAEPIVEPKSLDFCDRLTLFLFLLVTSLLSENAAQRKKLEALTAKVNQDSRNSNRPPSSDSPFKKQTSRQGTQGKPGARKGHEGHGPALLTPNQMVPVKPERCECGNTDFPTTGVG